MTLGTILFAAALVELPRRPLLAVVVSAASVVLLFVGGAPYRAEASELGAIYVDADTYQRTADELARCRELARVPVLHGVPRASGSVWDGFEALRREPAGGGS